jgi:hypothetical protein
MPKCEKIHCDELADQVVLIDEIEIQTFCDDCLESLHDRYPGDVEEIRQL